MCGLAGIISTEKTAFDVNHFNTLGALNDERGGDSCGIFIDGQVEYGIDDNAMFRNFMVDVDYPKSASIALLHCRKASVGYPVNLAQAQPVIIKRNNKVDFVLMHNGTISNIRVLSAKYLPKIDTFHLSDSQILARIIYKFGYDVLEEYTGCAVLIMVDYRSVTPKVLIFKGSSCYNEAKSKSERPLYYMINDDKFYFSSMYTSLYCINNKRTIYDFPVNQLCQIQNNKVYRLQEIDRTKLKKEYPVTGSYSSGYGASNSYVTDNLYYDKTTGIYMLNGAPAHGAYNVYPSGYLISEKYSYNANDPTFYFFCGRLLYDKDCFDFLKNIDDLFEDDVLPVYCPEVIDYFAYSPRMIGKELSTVDENFNYVKYLDGDYVSLFTSSDQITVSKGMITKSYIYPTNALEIFQNSTKTVFFNFEELEKQIMSFISNRLVNQDAIQ